MSNNNELIEAKERKEILYSRYKEAKESISKSKDSKEKSRQIERARILYGMYKDSCGDVSRLEGNTKKCETKVIHNDYIFNTTSIWTDINGMKWNGLDGAAWSDIEAARQSEDLTGRQSNLLIGLLNDGLQNCTELQKKYIGLYYSVGLSMPEISERYNVNHSSVSRAIKRGLARIAHQVIARLTIASCVDEHGKFDYIKFVQTASVLTERQTELIFLALSMATYRQMASYTSRAPSSISHGMNRAEDRLSAVRVDFIPELNVTGIKLPDWTGIDETALAEQLGMSRRFFYTAICRGRKIQEVPFLAYHVLCRNKEGYLASEIASELGSSHSYCRKVIRDYNWYKGPLDICRLPKYNPEKKINLEKDKHNYVLSTLRTLTSGGKPLLKFEKQC